MRTFIILLITILSLSANAQKLIVESFAKANGDISAQTNARNDNNNVKCALVKIQYVGEIMDVEGNVIKPLVKRVNETWVYLTQRSRQMQIITQNYLPLKITFNDYGIKSLESGVTYLLVLNKPNVLGIASQDIGGNFYALTVSPKNATVYIDDKIQAQTSDGQYSEMLSYGTHSYRVEAGGYLSKEGTFFISKGETPPISVSLMSSMASVSVTCPTPAVSLYIDRKPVGQIPWSGSLKNGMHLLEAKKNGYHSQQKTVTLDQQQKLDVDFDPLVAMKGSLSVNYKPFGAEVYLDGVKLGQSPRVFSDILAGVHKIEIKKDGYSTEAKSVTIEDGQTVKLTGILQVGSQSSNEKKSLWGEYRKAELEAYDEEQLEPLNYLSEDYQDEKENIKSKLDRQSAEFAFWDSICAEEKKKDSVYNVIIKCTKDSAFLSVGNILLGYICDNKNIQIHEGKHVLGISGIDCIGSDTVYVNKNNQELYPRYNISKGFYAKFRYVINLRYYYFNKILGRMLESPSEEEKKNNPNIKGMIVKPLTDDFLYDGILKQNNIPINTRIIEINGIELNSVWNLPSIFNKAKIEKRLIISAISPSGKSIQYNILYNMPLPKY